MADHNIFVGNTNSKALQPTKIYAGDENNKAKLVTKVYVGNSSNKAVQVWPKMKWSDTYQKCEYIYNATANEYIQLSKKPDNNTRVVITFKIINRGLVNHECYVFDAYAYYRRWGLTYEHWDYNTYHYKFFKIYYDYDVSAPHTGGGPVFQKDYTDANSLYQKYTLDFNRTGGYFYLDNTYIGQSQVTFPTTEFSNSIRIFSPWGEGNESNAAKVYIYGCKIYQGTNLIYDLVPCYRKNDLKPGLYDFANDYFHVNAASKGEFYKGPDVN